MRTSNSLPPPSGGSTPAAPAVELPSSLYSPAFVRLLLVQHVFGLSFSAYFLLPKYLAVELHADATSIGTVSALAMGVGVFFAPFLGNAIERYGRRSLLVLGNVLVLLTSLAFVAVDRVGPALYAIRLVQGVGFALVFNVLAASVVDLVPGRAIGNAMGLLGVSSLIANALGPALGEPLAHTFGWDALFFAAALVSVVALALGTTVEEPLRVRRETGPTRVTGLGDLWYAAAMHGVAFGAMFIFTQPFALERGATHVAIFFVGFTVAAIAVRLLFGRAADTVGRFHVARVALVAYGLTVLATSFLQPGLLGALGLALGVSHGMLYPSLAALVAERVEPAARPRALTYFHAAFNAGSGVAVLGLGKLASSAGYPTIFALVGAGTVLSVLALRPGLRRTD